MGYWFDEDDDDECLLNHLGDKVPDSIRKEAEMTLIARGYSREYIHLHEYEHDD